MIHDDETLFTKTVESQAKMICEPHFKCVMERMPGQYRFSDYIAYRDRKPVALIEIKGRNINYDCQNTVLLSWSKFANASTYVYTAGIPFVIVFGFLNCVAYYMWKGDKIGDWIKLGGRTKKTRRDQDLEPCVYIPMEELKMISMTPLEIMKKPVMAS